MEEFLKQHGYWLMGLFIFAKSVPIAGGFVSGNTALYLGALFAGLGDFNIIAVLVIGFLAVLLGDSLMFIAGKYFSDKFPKLQKLQDKIQPWLDTTHDGTNKIAYWYMHSGLIRAYLPFMLGYSQMNNMVWARKVTLASFCFVPVVSVMGYAVGRLEISGSAKVVISAALWIFASAIVAKLSHQIYKVVKS